MPSAASDCQTLERGDREAHLLLDLSDQGLFLGFAWFEFAAEGCPVAGAGRVGASADDQDPVRSSEDGDDRLARGQAGS